MATLRRVPILFIMCGLSFSGKTTLARRIAEVTGSVIVSYDALYATIERDPSLDGLEEWRLIVGRMHEDARTHLSAGRSVVVDNLNEEVIDRDPLREIAQKCGADAIVVYVDAPLGLIQERRLRNEALRERGSTRDDNFQFVLSRLQPPSPDERSITYRPDDDLDEWLRELLARVQYTVTADCAFDYAQWVLRPTLPRRPAQPQRSYFVCGVPRSGTWLLCGLLHSTGAAGRPHEYFWRDTERANRRAWRVSSFSDYLSRVLDAGTTENGVFGSKLVWGYMSDFVDRLRQEAGTSAGTDRSLIEQFFPQPHFVWVWREDIAAQAVSWAKAIQTGHWHHWDAGARSEPSFDFAEIDALAREVVEHNAAWRQWFAENGVEPLSVRYEDLVAGKESVTRQVLSFVGIELSGQTTIREQTAQTRDALSADWLARYRSLSA